MIKAVIFDLNGVFLEGELLSERIYKKYNLKKEEFLPVLSEIMDIVRKPKAPPSFRLWEPHLKRWKINLSEEEFFDFWFSGEKIVPEFLQYSRELRRDHIKVFILSNNFKERTDYYRRNYPEIFNAVDKAYFSWETGFTKSKKEAFIRIIEESKLKPEECVFFDDSKANVKVAKEVGIKAYLYTNIKETKKIINNLN